MRKYLGLALAIVALVIPATATAAYLHEAHQNSKCPTGYTGWHFVNNQIGGATAAYLTATFSTGTIANVPGEKKGNNAAEEGPATDEVGHWPAPCCRWRCCSCSCCCCVCFWTSGSAR